MKISRIIFLMTLLLSFSCEKEKEINFNSFKVEPFEESILTGESLEERMKHYNVPGVSIALVLNNKLHWAKGYGMALIEKGTKVDTNTLFQAGSISKPIAALGALKLLENGLIDLDEDVDNYLLDWKIPENDFTTEEKITVRRLLTHTAGTTVHGFPGYKQNDEFPTIEQVLNGEGNTKAVEVYTKPGSKWKYSGGGYTIMEKMIEDVSGLPLEVWMDSILFKEMGMKNSTFEQPLPEALKPQASAAYNEEGRMVKGSWHNYPEQAAAGLWTTPTDLAKYCIEIQEILNGKPDGVLKQETVEQMLTKHQEDWGLGPIVSNEGDSLLFLHGGKNAGFTNRFYASAFLGNALIIMTNGDQGRGLINEIVHSISAYYKLGYD